MAPIKRRSGLYDFTTCGRIFSNAFRVQNEFVIIIIIIIIIIIYFSNHRTSVSEQHTEVFLVDKETEPSMQGICLKVEIITENNEYFFKHCGAKATTIVGTMITDMMSCVLEHASALHYLFLFIYKKEKNKNIIL